MKHIAPYVLRQEFECPHCKCLPHGMTEDYADCPVIYSVLLDRFADVRQEWGRPIKITSGYRCPVYNRSIGGVLMSAHLFGLALDMDVGDAEQTVKLATLIESVCPEVRMGVYLRGKSYIHMDTAWLINPKVMEAWREGERWGDYA